VLVESSAYRHAAQIIVAAPRSTSLVADRGRISASNVHFVPNCVNMRESRPGPKQNGFRERHGLSDAFVVVYAGLMGIAQDLETIINCARKMASEKRVVFLMVGDGRNRDKWKAMAQDLPNVRFHKPVANEEYMDVLRAADVCLVSLSHALLGPAIPGKMSTIMAVGRPLIAVVPPWSDTVPLIRESKCGLAVTSADAAELQDAIEAMFNSAEFAGQLGANGFRYAQQNLSLDVVAPQIEEALVAAHRTWSRRRRRTSFATRWASARFTWRRRA
jgi:colanic acid biosynthesis glycosyl transferase WcaI